jgi:hypothetical protein
MNVIKMQPLPKWQEPPVHPAAANAMPMMSKAELRELARDIEKHGMLLTDEKLSKATQWLNEFQRAWTDARPGRRSS